MTRSYRAEIAKLADLETFDHRAFVAEDKPTQQCCDFVLALALAFNDIKGLLLGDHLLIGQVPADRVTPTRELGAFAGSHLHFIRVLLGVVRELLFLVKNERAARDHPLFQTVIKKLPKATRQAWAKVITASDAEASSDADIRFLVTARNTVSYHYGSKAIGRGYRRAFKDTDQQIFVSRGPNISATRFYFADRAAESYLQLEFGDQDAEKYFIDRPAFLTDIASSLCLIVEGFVTARGFGWRNAR